MHCLECNYPLVGIESQKCPECGCAFDPSDRATFNRAHRHIRDSLLLRATYIAAAILSVAAGALAVPLAADVVQPNNDFFMFSLMLWFILALVVFVAVVATCVMALVCAFRAERKQPVLWIAISLAGPLILIAGFFA